MIKDHWQLFLILYILINIVFWTWHDIFISLPSREFNFKKGVRLLLFSPLYLLRFILNSVLQDLDDD